MKRFFYLVPVLGAFKCYRDSMKKGRSGDTWDVIVSAYTASWITVLLFEIIDKLTN